MLFPEASSQPLSTLRIKAKNFIQSRSKRGCEPLPHHVPNERQDFHPNPLQALRPRAPGSPALRPRLKMMMKNRHCVFVLCLSLCFVRVLYWCGACVRARACVQRSRAALRSSSFGGVRAAQPELRAACITK